mmetsp:Transcript_1455/g.3748  ORF Transcript_1455/g.3748 Transcript_1455/m.3748 type:complete len:339 (+) Transcript_1455:427-1443(+)
MGMEAFPMHIVWLPVARSKKGLSLISQRLRSVGLFVFIHRCMQASMSFVFGWWLFLLLLPKRKQASFIWLVLHECRSVSPGLALPARTVSTECSSHRIALHCIAWFDRPLYLRLAAWAAFASRTASAAIFQNLLPLLLPLLLLLLLLLLSLSLLLPLLLLPLPWLLLLPLLPLLLLPLLPLPLPWLLFSSSSSSSSPAMVRTPFLRASPSCLPKKDARGDSGSGCPRSLANRQSSLYCIRWMLSRWSDRTDAAAISVATVAPIMDPAATSNPPLPLPLPLPLPPRAPWLPLPFFPEFRFTKKDPAMPPTIPARAETAPTAAARSSSLIPATVASKASR